MSIVIPIAAGAEEAAAGAAGANDVLHLMRPGPLQLAALPPLSLYVHLPWCLRKCPYCDFNSHEWRGGGGSSDALPEQRYIDALVADLDAALPLVWGRTVHTIFIGGGTPSLFSPAAIDRLIGDLRARLKLAPDCEITLEANPGTFERDRFRAYRAAGVTRLSVGVQSFNDEHLKALGRVHDRAQAIAAVEEAAAAFDTFNLDLMYALPGQTLEGLDADLSQALALGAAAPVGVPPDHRAQHLLRQVSAHDSRGRCGIRDARSHHGTHRRQRPPAIRDFGLRPHGPCLCTQFELLAVRRLPRNRRRRPQQVELCAPGGAAGAVPGATPVHGQRDRRPGGGAERGGRDRCVCLSNTCSMP